VRFSLSDYTRAVGLHSWYKTTSLLPFLFLTVPAAPGGRLTASTRNIGIATEISFGLNYEFLNDIDESSDTALGSLHDMS
jgi:hypothetical protein